jgi:hypothetical protein
MIYSKDFHYSIHGFNAGKRYKIHAVAYPKHHICGEPISSNREVRTRENKATFFGLSFVFTDSPFIRCRIPRGFVW